MNTEQNNQPGRYAKALYEAHGVHNNPLAKIVFLADRLDYTQLKMPDGRDVRVSQLHKEGKDALAALLIRLQDELYEQDESMVADK